MTKEQLYTSTQNKLLHNLDRLKEMQRGYFRLISILVLYRGYCTYLGKGLW